MPIKPPNKRTPMSQTTKSPDDLRRALLVVQRDLATLQRQVKDMNRKCDDFEDALGELGRAAADAAAPSAKAIMDIADDDKEQLLAGLKCHPHLIVEELELALLKPAAPIRRSPSSEAPEALESVQIFEMSVEGRLTCAQCDATFAKKKFGLKRHLSAHCDERPYMCAICGDGFARSDLLAKHCRRINDVYESRPEAQEPEEEEPQSEQMRSLLQTF
ncbi:hypothetical protein BKA81DRAFT_430367 [Phyllosticta paracitricarpa]|uniref:C2H2-type domain-containing protein n=1 Tax=Phyllosticta citricarpa TaxID=55181 RepID=A0ABR1MGH9_9PEZI